MQLAAPFALLLAASACGAAHGAAKDTGEPGVASRSRFHLYLLIGQSNMAGRGKVAKEDQAPHPRVLKLNKKDAWVPAIDPLHFDKSFAGVGPGIVFGKAMAEADPSVTIGLVPCAAGGSPITVWVPGAHWKQTRSKPYDDMLRRVKAARGRGVLKGILWHQGESDSNPTDAPLYAERLDDLTARIRRDLRVPAAPFLVGGLSDPLLARKPEAKTVDNALRGLPKRVAGTAYVAAEGLGLKSDNAHFTAASARELGRHYAKALLALRSQKPRK